MRAERQLDLVDAINDADAIPALLTDERRGLEYIQTLHRCDGKPTATAIGAYLKQDTSYGAAVIESLIRKGYLACEYTVLRPSIRDFVRVGAGGMQEVVR